jgi:hypothetical protein
MTHLFKYAGAQLSLSHLVAQALQVRQAISQKLTPNMPVALDCTCTYLCQMEGLEVFNMSIDDSGLGVT